MSQRYENYIGGEWTASTSNETLPNVNPADRRDVIGEFPNSTEADAIRAVKAARDAQPGWAAFSSHARGEHLRKAADILEARADQVARGGYVLVDAPDIEGAGGTPDEIGRAHV